MRLKAMALVPILAMVALGMSSSAASALPSPGVETTETAYTASYEDLVLGPVTCKGVHYTNALRNPGDENSGGRDVFTCSAPLGKKLTGVTGGQETTCYCGVEGQIQNPFYGWASDYFALKGKNVEANFMKGLVSPNAHSIRAEAKYPFPR